MKNSKESDNNRISTEIKLSAIWASTTLCYLYGDYFELYVPKKVTGLLNGNNLLDSPGKLFFAAVLLAIPALMVCLSVLLPYRVNRILNICVGSFYSLVMVLVALSSFSPWMIFYIFLAIVEISLTISLVIYSWKWRLN